MKRIGNCRYCGDEFKYYPSERRGHYCSQKCKNEYMWTFETRPNIIAGLTSGYSIKSFRRFITERDGEKCAECPTTDTWNEKPLRLHVDHIDGNRQNNQGDNLRFLCPNCHSQQPTSYRNKRFNQ